MLKSIKSQVVIMHAEAAKLAKVAQDGEALAVTYMRQLRESESDEAYQAAVEAFGMITVKILECHARAAALQAGAQMMIALERDAPQLDFETPPADAPAPVRKRRVILADDFG